MHPPRRRFVSIPASSLLADNRSSMQVTAINRLETRGSNRLRRPVSSRERSGRVATPAPLWGGAATSWWSWWWSSRRWRRRRRLHVGDDVALVSPVARRVRRDPAAVDDRAGWVVATTIVTVAGPARASRGCRRSSGCRSCPGRRDEGHLPDWRPEPGVRSKSSPWVADRRRVGHLLAGCPRTRASRTGGSRGRPSGHGLSP
jgi:hypothetical protein